MDSGFCRTLAAWLRESGVFLFTIVDGEFAGSRLLMQNEVKQAMGEASMDFWNEAFGQKPWGVNPALYEVGGQMIFAEQIIPEPELILCGGGHISVEVAALADYLGYPYVVIDDREEFVSAERFPGAGRRICKSFESVVQEYNFPGNPYYIIVTRGHAYDMQCLEWALSGSFGYVGMIGSRQKVQKTMDAMREKGYEESLLARVHAPIGLPIGGRTPQEIAVSIIAQLVETTNKKTGAGYMDIQMQHAIESTERFVLAEIVRKQGSAPREAGTKMLVGKNGILCGTIGGGAIEHAAELDAKKMLKQGGCGLYNYVLRNEAAGDLGMWCGGQVDVFLQAFGPETERKERMRL